MQSTQKVWIKISIQKTRSPAKQFPFIQAPRKISGLNGKWIFISFYDFVFASASRVIHKTSEDPNFGHWEIKYGTDKFSGLYFDNGINKKGISREITLIFPLQFPWFLIKKNKSV